MKLFDSRHWLAVSAASAMLAAVSALPAKAEVSVVNLAQQFGLLYVPLHVVLEHSLVEKHAKAIGLEPPEIKLFKISGGANINKALLAKTIDFGAHGVGPALKLWGRTKGKFKIASGMADMPLKLNTNDPNIKTVEDYLKAEDHKIATPAAKVSIQAVTLQMYADKKWGDPTKLDHMVVSMKHPDRTRRHHFRRPDGEEPFRDACLIRTRNCRAARLHNVITSYDILGGQHTVLVMSASQAFKDANPKTYEAVLNAYNEAFEWVNANPPKQRPSCISNTPKPNSIRPW